MRGKITIDKVTLERLQRETFSYFLHETNPENGLVKDKTASDWPASIAATGLALTIYPLAVEHSFITRDTAIQRVLATLRFFRNSRQGTEPDATGYHGFYYHFLDMHTGKRAWKCELSTVDSAILLAGILTVGVYFNANVPSEVEIRNLANELYVRADWQWAQNKGATVTHGWKPERGYSRNCWGLTASDGPGPCTLSLNGKKHRYFDYKGRGVPYGPDDGTVAPWAVFASLPFAPEIVLPTIDYLVNEIDLKLVNHYGFKATFNPSCSCNSNNSNGWVSPWHFGINQGPIIAMIENYITGFLWSMMRTCSYFVNGLNRAGSQEGDKYYEKTNSI